MSILVVLEQAETGWNPTSLDAIAAAREIRASTGLPMEAAVLGRVSPEAMSQVAKEGGIGKVFRLDHPALARYTPEAFTLALEQLLKLANPKYILFPHTYQVRDYAPKLATRFRRSLISDVMGIKADQNCPLFIRQLFLGKLLAAVRGAEDPTFVSVQANSFSFVATREADLSDLSGTIENVSVQIDSEQIETEAEAPVRGLQSSVNLRDARVIVAAGRGVKQKEELNSIQALARELNAELAASRPVCDSGWVPMDRLVGTSGQSVAPDVYFAIGISGAIQHMLGMKGAKTVVAINIDESAPIFDSAQYGIVGDLRTVVPALIDELQKIKS